MEEIVANYLMSGILCIMLLCCTSVVAMATDTLTDEELIALYTQVASNNIAVDEQFRIQTDQNDLSINESLPDEWWNILLLGTDTGGALNYGRTDAMLILSIQRTTGEMKLTSLIRDMWVDIPGLKLPGRINAANSFGGPYLAVKTVNSVLNLNIQHFCSINFLGLQKFVDSIGGVTLDITKAEASVCGAQYQEGGTVLFGEEALKYARIRKLDSTFGRSKRHRTLLIGLGEKVVGTMSFTQILGLVTEMLPYVDTNLTVSDIFIFVRALTMNEGLDIKTLSLPPEDSYSYGSRDGFSYMILIKHK